MDLPTLDDIITFTSARTAWPVPNMNDKAVGQQYLSGATAKKSRYPRGCRND
jgi:hypothetical protein